MSRVLWVSLVLAALFEGLLLASVALGQAVFTDGPQLSYVRQRDGNNWDIYLTQVRRGVTVNLTRGLFVGDARNRLPAWSPDGQRLAFTSDALGRTEIYVYQPFAGNLRQLTQTYNIYYSQPSWSLDGTQLVVGATLSTPNGVRVIDVETGNTRGLTSRGLQALSPVWSPDAGQVAFVVHQDTGRELYTVQSDGSGLQRISSGSTEMGKPVWSPDGDYVAYTDRLGQSKAVYAINAADKSVRLLYMGRLAGDELSWSAAQDAIAVQRLRGQGEMTLLNGVRSLLETGGMADPVTVLDGPGYQTEPEWSSDGAYLAFVVARNGYPGEIYISDQNTRQVTRLTANTVNDWSPVWR